MVRGSAETSRADLTWGWAFPDRPESPVDSELDRTRGETTRRREASGVRPQCDPAQAAGRRSVNSVNPGREVTSAVPPWASITDWTIARPNPVESFDTPERVRAESARTNRWKTVDASLQDGVRSGRLSPAVAQRRSRHSRDARPLDDRLVVRGEVADVRRVLDGGEDVREPVWRVH